VVAQAISYTLNCDIEEVTDTKKRSGFIGFVKSGREIGQKKLTKIIKPKYDPALYDIIIIGTPVWRDSVSIPIRTYVIKYKDKFQKVAFFCTQGLSKTNVFSEMEKLIDKKPLATLRLTQKEVEREEFLEKVNCFLDEIRRVMGAS